MMPIQQRVDQLVADLDTYFNDVSNWLTILVAWNSALSVLVLYAVFA